jgi:hypothetical protein
MIDIVRVKTNLTRMAELLRMGGRQDWAQACDSCNKDIAQDPDATTAKILSMYGGVGSLNDLILYKDGKVLVKENGELDDLRSQLYSLCRN